MSTVFADPSRFQVVAGHHDGTDPDLPPGTHVRWMADPSLGLPLAPMEVWRIPARPEQLNLASGMFWVGSDNKPLAEPGRLRPYGMARVWGRVPVTDGRLLVGLEAQASHGQPVELRLLQPTGLREIARRTEAPRIVASQGPWHLELRGEHDSWVRGWFVEHLHMLKALDSPKAAELLGPPVERAHWHPAGLGEGKAEDRVRMAAPQREPWIDRPEMAPQRLQPPDEMARLADLLPEWRQRLQELLTDRAVPPALVVERHHWPAVVEAARVRRPWQSITGPAIEALHAAALDTGLARWLGLMTFLDGVPATVDAGGEVSEAILVAGLFAEPAGASAPPDAHELALIEGRLRDREVARLAEQLPRLGLRTRFLAAVALNAPFPDRPIAPAPRADTGLWHRAPDGPDVFSRRLLLPNPPAAALLGVAVLKNGQWQARHEQSGVPLRSRIRLPGALSAERRLRLGGMPHVLVDESGLAADEAPWPCRIVLGDLFGRYGPAVDGELAPPDRPPVPPPVLHATLRRAAAADAPADGIDLTAPPPDPVDLPDPEWHAQVEIPRLEDLPAGSWPVVGMAWSLDGVPLAEAPQMDLQPGQIIARSLRVQGTDAGKVATASLGACFIDDHGRSSQWVQVTERWVDGRIPAVPVTGTGLLWTTRPGSADEVVLALTVPASPPGRAPANRCRVYITDAAALGIAERAPDGRQRSRAEVARLAGDLGPDATSQRDAFRLALPEPVPAADGRCQFSVRLPRALQSVQLLRIVPMTEGGQEPAFRHCPLLAVAVPTDRRPPPPLVQAQIDGQTGLLTVSIRAEGLDLNRIDGDEPGCRRPEAPPDTRWPRWRLRMASGAVARPFYARVLDEGELHWSADDLAFVGEWSDSALPLGWPSYVPITLWAEVALPAERRLPSGAEWVAWSGGAIEPESPAATADCPRPYSEPSAPTRVIRVPPVPPALDAGAVHAESIRKGPQQWTLNLAVRGPTLHAGAIAPCRVEAAYATAGGSWHPIALPDDGALINGQLQIELAVTRDRPDRLWINLIDPLGRREQGIQVPVAGDE